MMKTYRRIIMGMPVIIQVPESTLSEIIDTVFDRLTDIDQCYSPYKQSSVVSQIRHRKMSITDASTELLEILDLAQIAKENTNGYFDIFHHGLFDPSGVVKGWAISQAADILTRSGLENFIIEIAGDMVCCGFSDKNTPWKVGIRAPFESNKIVKQALLTDMAIATSGTTERGQHIYNPKSDDPITDILSMTVIGPDIRWADIYATASFAMGRAGIDWIESLPDYEGFAILPDMSGISTTGLSRYQA